MSYFKHSRLRFSFFCLFIGLNFWRNISLERWSATSKDEVREKYGGWPMLKMSYSGFTAELRQLGASCRGLKLVGADSGGHQPVLAVCMKNQPDLG